MQTGQQKLSPVTPAKREVSIFNGLLRGYRFTVCEDRESVARAIDVRRRVYRDGCGYDVPVPDDYDGRSWLLLAEHVASGEAVGSMRITPRFAGAFEAEAYLRLPAALTRPTAVEITRFAIVPEHRHSRRFLPVVALGLYKLACLFMRQVGATDVVICSRPARTWAYRWLAFSPAGLTCRYSKLGNAEHELLTCDVADGMVKHRDHRFWEFVFEIVNPELVLPEIVPIPGFDGRREVATASLRRSA